MGFECSESNEMNVVGLTPLRVPGRYVALFCPVVLITFAHCSLEWQNKESQHGQISHSEPRCLQRRTGYFDIHYAGAYTREGTKLCCYVRAICNRNGRCRDLPRLSTLPTGFILPARYCLLCRTCPRQAYDRNLKLSKSWLLHSNYDIDSRIVHIDHAMHPHNSNV